MPASKNLTIIRGDDVALSTTISNNNIPLNITGFKFYFTAKISSTDPDSAAVITQDWTTHSDATNGKTDLILSSSQTSVPIGTYYYDIQYKDTSGKIMTVAMGILVISQDITLRTT